MGMYFGHFDFDQPLLWTVPDLLSPAECHGILTGVSTAEWLSATVNSYSGRVVDAKIRNSTTAIVREPALAEELFRRVRAHLPQQMSSELFGPERRKVDIAGINLPLRIYRYEPGQQFGLHNDQSYSRADGARSLLTFMVYLNEDFEGGETEFPDERQVIVPKTGMALLFQHMVLHSGNEVRRGTKYVLRSDVLYLDPAVAGRAPEA